MNIVVGGGWAGLAAAVEMARHGLPVTLIEAADELGGRGRRVQHRDLTVDSGQHLMLGAYHGVLRLLDIMGVPEAEVFDRRPLELITRSTRGPELRLRLRLPSLPAPLQLIAGLAGARGLRLSDKYRAMRFCVVAASRPTGRGDCSVMDLLQRHRQSTELIERLWEPLCLAALNTPLAEASATLFTRVLRDAFRRRRDSDLLFPRCDLGGLIPRPAHGFIESRGGRILLGRRVSALEVREGRMAGVKLTSGDTLNGRHVIVAVPPEAGRRLLEPVPGLQAIAAQFAGMQSAPICTVYLQYPPHTRLPFPMVGLHGGTIHWVFDHAHTGRPGLMAAVISGPGSHMKMDKFALQARAADELAGFFPHWPAPERGAVLREKRATFLSNVGIDARRPGVHTPLEGCWLAGDAVDTRYPATLEGAVRSGLEAARRVFEATEGREG